MTRSMRDRIENAQVMLVHLSAPTLIKDWRSPIRPVLTVKATATIEEQLKFKAAEKSGIIN